jgi:mannan endo-1,4-beta-mannosidase
LSALKRFYLQVLDMRVLLPTSVLLGFGPAVEGILRSTKDPSPPAPIYPIGTEDGPFARVSGRLFEVDGRTGYFSGTDLQQHVTENWTGNDED